MLPVVTNIQRYSIHDGDGIRSTVFFKGCPLKCRWCHNPECQSYDAEPMFHAQRCTGCGQCISSCHQQAILLNSDKVFTNRKACIACGECTYICPNDAREVAGKQYTIKELVTILEKDRIFYEQSGGGITLSGGEVLSQNMDYIEELAKTLHRKGYSVYMDTCGFVPYEHLHRVLPWTDKYLYDIKQMDSAKHLEYTGCPNELILENLIKLQRDGARIQIRLPLIDGVNASNADIDAIIDFLKRERINPTGINLLPYHDTGAGKYGQIDRTYEKSGMETPSAERMEELRLRFIDAGFTNIKIGG